MKASALGAICVLLGWGAVSSASAQDLGYQPISPTFGGNPFNSSHLLGVAGAQNNYKDPDAAANQSMSEQFARQLQSRLLSALSSQLTESIFGENARETGTISFGGQTVTWRRDLENVTVEITDDATGQVTTVVVPSTLAIG